MVGKWNVVQSTLRAGKKAHIVVNTGQLLFGEKGSCIEEKSQGHGFLSTLDLCVHSDFFLPLHVSKFPAHQCGSVHLAFG